MREAGEGGPCQVALEPRAQGVEELALQGGVGVGD